MGRDRRNMDVVRNLRKSLSWFFVFLLVLAVFPIQAIGFGFEILPYVQGVQKTSAMVLWKGAGQEQGRVEYGPTPAYGSSAEGRIKWIRKNGSGEKVGSIVESRLNGLIPGSVYHYRVSLRNCESQDRIFRTSPLDRDAAFTFVVYGDSRSDPAAHGRVISAAAACHPAFVLDTGDLVLSSEEEQSAWTDQFFGPADLLLRESWFAVTRGNHEGKSPFFPSYFGGAGHEPNKGYYSFDWGAVHVVTLDTNVEYKPGSEQYEFLKKDLGNTDRPLKVFFGHHPMYSSGTHGGVRKMQRYLQPLFEKNGVALVLGGHDHHYERTVVEGVTYIVSGGGGARLSGNASLTWKPGDSVFKRAHHFVQVDVASGMMSLTSWAIDLRGATNLIDRTTISR